MYKVVYAMYIGSDVRVYTELIHGKKQANILANSVNSVYGSKVVYTIVEAATDGDGESEKIA